MKTAVVHDWLVTYAGAEMVLEQILNCFPQADLFSLVDFLPPDSRGFIQNKKVATSFIQRLPFAKGRYRSYFPLMPIAIEQFDLSGYDLVISSSYAVAKGVLTGPDQLHLCMCYSPMRYAWDLQHQYLKYSGLDRGPKSWLARWMLQRMRLWDVCSANRVDRFVAISEFIARRIRKAYRRDSTVIYPPVDVEYFKLRRDKEEFYVTASRLVPYKRVDLIIEAFSRMPDKRLVVIGDGPEFRKLKAMAGRNVVVLGYQTKEALRDYLQHARAFVFAAEEDFGIAPLEALACGTPVIAYGKGGVLETVTDAAGADPDRGTGVFFSEQTAPALAAAVERFEALADRISPENCRESVLRFAPERFRSEFVSCVQETRTRHDRHE